METSALLSQTVSEVLITGNIRYSKDVYPAFWC